MKKEEEAKLAFDIFKTMVRLDSMLWTRYFNEFGDLMMDQENAESSNDDSKDIDDFPF